MEKALSPARLPAALRGRLRPLLFPLLDALLVVAWSSGFVGIRYATEVATVPQVLFWRSLVSGLVLLPLALVLAPLPGLRAVGQQAVLGFFGMVVYLGGFALAIGQRVPTGLVALMADLVPLAIAILSAPLLGQRLSARQWLGTGLGLAGVLVVSAHALSLGEAPAHAYALPILGMLSFAAATVWQETGRLVPLGILWRLCLQCLSAAAVFGAVAAVAPGGPLPPLTAEFVLGIAWLVGLATLAAWGIYYLALRLWSPARVSAVIYLSPPVTLIWAWALFGEPMGAAILAGMAVSLAGVWLVARAPREGG